MFSRKNVKQAVPASDDQILKEKINHDLLVRNMPSLNRLAGTTVQISPTAKTSHPTSGSSLNLSGPNNKHKQIGLLIIIGGILLISGLVYASYIFIIKPATVPQQTSQVDNAQSSVPASVSEKTSVLEEANVPASSAVVEIDPTTLTIEEAAESETEEVMAEEIMAEEGSIFTGIDLPPLIDTDNDGLNDNEEEVLGTDPNKTDTNDNTYPDLLEVRNGYNPSGAGRLFDNDNLKNYTDSFFDYSLLYPKDWEFSLIDDNQLLVFYTPDDSLIQIYVQENSAGEKISDWYLRTFPERELLYDKIKIKDSWEGIENPNSLNVYITDNNRKNIYIISYIPAVAERITYPNIFDLMVESLVLPLN